ncbi:hypothetical protein KCU65_g8178, partial [Aureobasidium melanogenum]
MPPKRMTANPLAPLRYRPGKAVGQDESSSSEEESGSESENEQQRSKTTTTTAPPKATSFPKFNSNISKAELERRRQEAQALRAREAELAQKAQEGFETASESEDSGSEEDSASEDDSEEESEEETAPTRRFVAPTFVSKAQRKNTAATAPQQSSEDLAAQEEAKRKEKADALLQAQIEKDAQARAAGRRAWDDEDPDAIEDVDDTDNLDPEAELAAWKLRELRRVKRDRETIEAAEKEREEIERRRNLTAEQREAEDTAHILAQKEEKEQRGQAGFMQKYHHKGAFFQDDEQLAEISKRDIMGAKFQDDSGNREILPQYMQIRDMTKLGRKGRTKYKDLKAEDTGRWGAEDYDRRGGPGYGGDRYRDREGATGANASVVGERRRRDDDRGGRDEKRPRYD